MAEVTTNPYLQNLMRDVKNMGVKHVRKMFVLLRMVGTDLRLCDMEPKTNWADYSDLNDRLHTLVVQHGLTLGEFATGYVLNIQARQRPTTCKEESVTPAKNPPQKRKRPSLPNLHKATTVKKNKK